MKYKLTFGHHNPHTSWSLPETIECVLRYNSYDSGSLAYLEEKVEEQSRMLGRLVEVLAQVTPLNVDHLSKILGTDVVEDS